MGNSFLTKEEALRLYRFCKEMPFAYEHSPYSTDQCDAWDYTMKKFRSFVVAAAHLTSKFSSLGDEAFDMRKLLELGNMKDYGEGFVDWYSGYEGASSVLERCGLMANSLAGAEYFAGCLFDNPLLSLEQIAVSIVDELKDCKDEYVSGNIDFNMLSDDADPYDDYYIESDFETSIALEFAEGILDMCSNGSFDISDYQSIADLFKVVCFIFGLESSEDESVLFFKKHMKEFIVTIFGSGRVDFVSCGGSEFCAMVSCKFYLHEKALDYYLGMKDKQELSEEEEAFEWAMYSIATTYYESLASGLAEVVPVDGNLLFIRVCPQVADSSDGFDSMEPAIATVFAPLILDAMCQKGGAA